MLFSHITRSKVGLYLLRCVADVLAWLRILFAEAPRQVINALTLYSVMRLSLIPTGEKAAKDGHTPVVQFFVNVGVLADEQGQMAAVILFGMLFTVVIWVFTFINLMVAVLMYLFFLFHHIPSTDGSLSAFCRRKINKSMEKIVKVKVDKALRKENALRARQEARQGEGIARQPTLPNLDQGKEGFPALSRQPTQSTLPEYSSRPGTAVPSPSDLERQPSLPYMDNKSRPDLTRTDTHASSASWASQGSNAPLISGAGEMGYGPAGRMQSPPIVSPTGSYGSRSQSIRSYAPSQRSYTPGGQRPGTSRSAGTYQMEPVSRTGTMSSRQTSRTAPSPVESSYGRRTPVDQQNPYFAGYPYPNQNPAPPLPRSNTQASAASRSYTPGPPTSRSMTPASGYNRSYTPRQGSIPSPASAAPSYQPMPEPTLPNIDTMPTPASSTYRAYSPATPGGTSGGYSTPTGQAGYSTPTGQAGYSTPTGHAPPTQRQGTGTPRQQAPVADHVMEDIMNGY